MGADETGVDKTGADKMGVDETRVDEMGVDKMGRHCPVSQIVDIVTTLLNTTVPDQE